MVAMLDDPAAPAKDLRDLADAPHIFPPLSASQRQINSRSFILKPLHTTSSLSSTLPSPSPDQALILPFSRATAAALPSLLLTHLTSLFNAVILEGATYPMLDTLTPAVFTEYWFANFGAIAFLSPSSPDSPPPLTSQNAPSSSAATTLDSFLASLTHPAASSLPLSHWQATVLGTFYIKPNYPGRSSHVSNAGFLTAPRHQRRGVATAMGEAYLDWAPRLGYVYSVFNLVYASNVASVRVWEGLGFQRIGTVPGAGAMAGQGGLVDALIYGRSLAVDEGPGEDGAAAA